MARCKLWTCSSLNGGSKLWAWNNNFNVTRLQQHCRVNKKRSPLPGPRSSFWYAILSNFSGSLTSGYSEAVTIVGVRVRVIRLGLGFRVKVYGLD